MVDELTFQDALDLLAYWTEYPPVHVAVRALFSDETKKSTAPKEYSSEDDIRDLIERFGPKK